MDMSAADVRATVAAIRADTATLVADTVVIVVAADTMAAAVAASTAVVAVAVSTEVVAATAAADTGNRLISKLSVEKGLLLKRAFSFGLGGVCPCQCDDLLRNPLSSVWTRQLSGILPHLS